PIIGPRTLDQLVDNLGAAEVKLAAEDVERLDRAAPPRSVSMPYYDAALAVDFNPNFERW
ncbi:MAG TPA: aldo/keto reductase, partial [Gammaproteobacteria bacterium]|nr:aldo/keto reductase [Gammaproteobacteria bacterium]